MILNFVVIINRGVQPFFLFLFYSITGTVIKPQWRPNNLLLMFLSKHK